MTQRKGDSMECPFCGHHGDLVAAESFTDQCGETMWCVRCKHCLADGPIEMSKESAERKWMLRYVPFSQTGDGHIKCPKCKATLAYLNVVWKKCMELRDQCNRQSGDWDYQEGRSNGLMTAINFIVDRFAREDVNPFDESLKTAFEECYKRDHDKLTKQADRLESRG